MASNKPSNIDKPSNVEEYQKWLSEKHKVDLDKKYMSHYESSTTRIVTEIEKSTFWRALKDEFKEIETNYFIKTKGYQLTSQAAIPVVQIKPYESLLLKTLRKNCLLNKNWPDPPGNGWILPDNWFAQINDVVRTLFVVKYLDGVQYLAKQIEHLCVSKDMKFKVHLEAREEGYYAAHIYTKIEVEIPKMNWDTEKVLVPFEIQITTQLQEVIRALLHQYYEQERLKDRKSIQNKWQWDYKSDEFVANYLGHILHYVEGMIMDVRDKQRE